MIWVFIVILSFQNLTSDAGDFWGNLQGYDHIAAVASCVDSTTAVNRFIFTLLSLSPGLHNHQMLPLETPDCHFIAI
jgi:hypothetical protein